MLTYHRTRPKKYKESGQIDSNLNFLPTPFPFTQSHFFPTSHPPLTFLKMIEDPSTTTTWPNMSPGDADYYTLDDAYLYVRFSSLITLLTIEN